LLPKLLNKQINNRAYILVWLSAHHNLLIWFMYIIIYVWRVRYNKLVTWLWPRLLLDQSYDWDPRLTTSKSKYFDIFIYYNNMEIFTSIFVEKPYPDEGTQQTLATPDILLGDGWCDRVTQRGLCTHIIHVHVQCMYINIQLFLRELVSRNLTGFLLQHKAPPYRGWLILNVHLVHIIKWNSVVDPKAQQQSELTHVVTPFKYSKYESLRKLF
jgi:hypothetical protein